MNFKLSIAPIDGMYKGTRLLWGTVGAYWGLVHQVLVFNFIAAPTAHLNSPLCAGGKFVFDFKVPKSYPHDAPKAPRRVVGTRVVWHGKWVPHAMHALRLAARKVSTLPFRTCLGCRLPRCCARRQSSIQTSTWRCV